MRCPSLDRLFACTGTRIPPKEEIRVEVACCRICGHKLFDCKLCDDFGVCSLECYAKHMRGE